MRPSSIQRATLASVLLLAGFLTLNGDVTSSSASSSVGPSECPFSESCGVTHQQTKYQKGRSVTRVYIPEGDPGSEALYDNIACLVERAKEVMTSSCPHNDVFSGIEVHRGQRPPESTADIEISLGSASLVGDLARWIPEDSTRSISNEIHFSRDHPGLGGPLDWACAGSGDSAPTREQRKNSYIMAHELGHAFGLCHDGMCEPSNAPRSIMRRNPDGDMEHAFDPAHCAAIKRVNCADGEQPLESKLPETEAVGDCCLYCEVPRFRDLCVRLQLPIACGGPIFPPQGEICYHVIHSTRVTFNITTVVEIGGQFFETLDVVERTFRTSSINCTLFDPFLNAESGSLAGDGPMILVRTEYPQGASGLTKIAGFARDDDYGVRDLEFWVNGQAVELQQLQRGLFDEYVCSEVPAADCDPFSRFEGYLDTSELGDGFHTLQVIATNHHPISPIPTYYETTILVDNGCDTAPAPSATLTSPSPDTAVQGTVSLQAKATTATGVEKVVFYVDGEYLDRDLTAPYSLSWDSTNVADGPRTLQARVVDLCGRAAWSPQVPVTVANGQPVTLQFTPTDDTWVSQDEPDRSFGPYNFLRIRTTDGGHGRHAYLKFQVAGVTGPVTSVKLRLRTQETEIPAMGVYRMTDPAWTEGTLTWSNASLAQSGYWGDFLSWPGNTWRDLDLTGSVGGDGVYTFALASPLPIGMMDFWSKESGSYGPVLEVSFVPGP